MDKVRIRYDCLMASWVKRLERDAPRLSRAEGERIFRSEGVTNQNGSPSHVDALVLERNKRYAVDIELEGDDVIAVCSCGFYDVCKHVWAALLAAESAGHLQQVASRSNLTLIALDEFDILLDETGKTSPGPAPAKPSPPQAPAPPAWKDQLTALRRLTEIHPVEPPPRHRRIVYLIDLVDSISANGLVLKIGESNLKKNGEWGKAAFHNGLVRSPSTLDGADRRLLALLAGSGNSYYGYAHSFDQTSTRHRVPASTFDVIIPLLCATERFYVGSFKKPEEQQLLRWDDGAPWEFRLRVPQNESQNYTLEGILRRDNEDLPLSAPVLILPGLAILPGVAARFDDKKSFAWVSFLRKSGPITVPATHFSELMEEFVQFPSLPPSDLPDELRIEGRTFAGPPQVKVRPIQDSWRAQKHLECEIHFNYGVSVAESNPASSLRDGTNGPWFTRDRPAEHEAIRRLESFGMQRNSSWRNTGYWELPASRLPAMVRTLVAEGWLIEAEGKLYRGHGKFRIGVTSGIDWLELEGGADFEGQTVELPELLKALGRGEHMVALDDGSYGLLPEDWLKRYRLIAGFGKTVEGRLRFAHRQASLLDALLANEPEATFDEGFQRIRREMESFSGVKPAVPSRRFKGSLRGYQQEGLGWLQFTRRLGLGACLADDMGLGKTVQVLALIDSIDRKGPVLVVMPRSLVFNWIQEAARFTPKLKVLDWSGIGRKGQWDSIQKHDIVVTTYGTLRRDIAELRDISFDTVVLDEAQSIKNAATESAKAARLLSANHRIALSGTPIENRLSDLWSLFEFLNPGLLGSGTVFRTQTSEAPSAESSRILSMALRPFFLRRTKEKVAKELPPKTEQTIYCELDANQRKLYDELRTHYRAVLLGQIEEEGIEKSRMHILEALLRLRQAACHPGLIDKARAGESSAKLDSLLPQLQEVAAEGHKAIVFSQFTSLLAILRKRLDEAKLPYEYLDGRTKDRNACVRRFQEDPACPLFLVSLKAGGLGLNLTAAEYVFLLDPWWNPAVEAQAIDRAHRIGQSRHVFAYRLIARDTVEEKVIELQKSTRALADAIITADNSVLAGLTRETLELLLS